MHIPKLSLYIIAQDEEARLPLVLESAREIVDEMVVVDSGSTDGTEAAARAFGARFLPHEWVSVGHQVKWAEEQCGSDWVLRLDADEALSPELASEIMEARRNGRHDAYRLRIGEMTPGRTSPSRLVWHYKQIRLYDRRAWSMTGLPGNDEAKPVKNGATEKLLRGFVKHYSFMSVRQTLAKNNDESDRLAERAAAQGKNYSPFRMVGMFSLNFLKRFFLHRFFIYGFWGLIFSEEYAFFRFMKFAKFYEKKQFEKIEYPPKASLNKCSSGEAE
jgi:glycosyltransferase involved in cell wall biosynthesis